MIDLLPVKCVQDALEEAALNDKAQKGQVSKAASGPQKAEA